MQRHREVGCVGLVLIQLGCAAIVDFPDAPELVVEPESVESGLETESRWRCLSEPATVAAPDTPMARVSVQVCDELRGCSTALSGIRGRVCDKLDVNCASPLYTGTTNVAGALEFEVPTDDGGFDGYLELSGPMASCTNADLFGEASPLLCSLLPECDPQAPDTRCDVPTHTRALRFFNPPIVADLPQPVTHWLLPSAALPGIVRATGADFDPATGSLVVTVVDCDGVPAPDISYAMGETSGQITQAYMESGVLSAGRNATDASGVGAFAGVTPGFTDVVAYNAAGVHVGGVGVLMAPFSITYTTLVPKPLGPNRSR
jgi:hypothetical protein